MRAMATGISRRPDRGLLPWPIQCPEFGEVISLSGRWKWRNPQRPLYHPPDGNTQAGEAFLVCTAHALARQASVYRPNQDENATPTVNSDFVEDTMCAGDAPGSKKTGLASSTGACRASSDRPNLRIVDIQHCSAHSVLDHSSGRSALTVLLRNAGDRGLFFVASLAALTCGADYSEAKFGLCSQPKHTSDEALVLP